MFILCFKLFKLDSTIHYFPGLVDKGFRVVLECLTPTACSIVEQVLLYFSLTSMSLRDEVIVHIRRPEDTPLNSNRRLIWCPFIPEDNDENPEDMCQTLALLHEDRVCFL